MAHRILTSSLSAALALLMVVASADPDVSAWTQAAGLKIVVIAGEDAVNIIQQKTAVAPIVEVRDRNDQPVAGAVVNFATRGGRATFGGARTLTVTTDLLGRATATGLTPTASGVVQISASAAFQGQTAAVTIAQTNVLNAAQAAAVSGTGGGTAAGAAAAGGGGLSALAITAIVGGVGAGALVATHAGRSGGGGTTSPSGSTASGRWTGRASGVETADFTLVLNQNGTTVTGSGDVFFPGDGNRFQLDVSGSVTGSNVALTLQPLPQRTAITLTGSLDGSVINGRLNGGDIQHDGPFPNTPLTLSRR